jgi:hypothetical protein
MGAEREAVWTVAVAGEPDPTTSRTRTGPASRQFALHLCAFLRSGGLAAQGDGEGVGRLRAVGTVDERQVGMAYEQAGQFHRMHAAAEEPGGHAVDQLLQAALHAASQTHRAKCKGSPES